MANETFTRPFDAWGYSAAVMILVQPGICQLTYNHSQVASSDSGVA